jgi:hypothetical protein
MLQAFGFVLGVHGPVAATQARDVVKPFAPSPGTIAEKPWRETGSMRKVIKNAVVAVATSSTTYVSCSTAAGQAFRDAAIDGVAGVIEQPVAELLGTMPDGSDEG